MRMRSARLFVVLVAFARSTAFGASTCTGATIMSLPLAAASAPAAVQLGDDLLLRVEPDDGGWELEVVDSKGDMRGNLLAAIRNWHGAQPFLVTAYMASLYPNERVLPIRGTTKTLCIRLVDPRIEEKGADARYVAGTMEVRVSTNRHADK